MHEGAGKDNKAKLQAPPVPGCKHACILGDCSWLTRMSAHPCLLNTSRAHQSSRQPKPRSGEEAPLQPSPTGNTQALQLAPDQRVAQGGSGQPLAHTQHSSKSSDEDAALGVGTAAVAGSSGPAQKHRWTAAQVEKVKRELRQADQALRHPDYNSLASLLGAPRLEPDSTAVPVVL